MRNAKGKEKTKRDKRQELLNRLLAFSVAIIKIANKLPKSPSGYSISNQIIRSGTSIGANCEEAQDAMSKKDFLKSINISLKEARETKYWLKVISSANLLSSTSLKNELQECNEIIAILVSSVKTIKKNNI